MFDEFTGLDNLNKQQTDAILNSLKDNSLVLAGAGSGKTKVLITRIEYLIKVLNVEPNSIMAITFTNKAAKELLTRAEKVTSKADEMTVGTYHSICMKLLREFGEDIGIDNFSILDKPNAIKCAKNILTEMGLVASKQVIVKYMSKISKLKNKLINPKKYREIKMKKYSGNAEKFRDDAEYDFIEFYSKFQLENYNNRTLDFDDMIMYTMTLLQASDNARDYIRETYKFIHADEVQDSNESNIRLLNEFSKYCNLFMVGDLDQSIYGFRNARPDYFLKLRDSGNIKIFKLEENYRSTKTIVNASNEIIKNNFNRIPKTCFSNKDLGEKIQYFNFPSNNREAQFVADEISMYKEFDYKYSDFMVLYRTNAQSRAFEEVLLEKGIPYILVGAISFNDRAEIKDCLAFLRLYVNRKDKYSFMRALSKMEGVGKETIKDIMTVFDDNRDALETLKEYKPKRENAKKGLEFLFQVLMLADNKPTAVLNLVADKLIKKLEVNLDDKAIEKIENIKELLRLAKQKESAGAMISDFVNQMDLLSKSDTNNSVDAVQLITVHSSKGLESKIVFVTGMSEGIFPHENSLHSDDDVEEERRCMYVACTRPMEKLYLSSYDEDGERKFKESRFISEIPEEYIDLYR